MAVFLPAKTPISIPNGKFELDTDHWLFPSMRFAMYPGSQGSGLKHVDLKTHERFERIGTPGNATFKRDLKGGYLDCVTSGTDGVDAAEIALGQPTSLDGLGEITILTGYMRTGNQDVGFGRIISRSNGGTGDDWSVTIEQEISNNNIRWRVEGSSFLSNLQTVIGDYYDIQCTYKPGARAIYVDGVLDNSDTLNVGTLPDDQNVSLLAHPDSTTRGITGNVYYVVVLDRALTQGEVSAFNSNPYQILKPIRPTIYYTLPSGVPDIDPAFIPMGIGPSSTVDSMILLGLSPNPVAAGGRIMGSLAGKGGLAGQGGIAGRRGGLA